MNYINIGDDYFDYTLSKWIIEEALRKGCDGFSFRLEKVMCETSKKYQLSLKEHLEKYLCGEHEVEVIYDTGNIDTWRCRNNIYKLDRNSAVIILESMGRSLMDWYSDLNKGISNWHFYKGNEMEIGVSVVDDFCTINEPSVEFIEFLKKKEIVYVEGRT